jgi:hypothetical protein
MAMPTGRSDKRITEEMAAGLVRPDASQFTAGCGSDGTRLAPRGTPCC